MDTMHTPGPWVARDDPAKERLRIFGGTWTVAFLPAHSPIDAANARLIAAAPELLAALELLRKVAFHLDRCPAHEPGVIDGCNCGYDEAEEDAYAAIAKARGGA